MSEVIVDNGKEIKPLTTDKKIITIPTEELSDIDKILAGQLENAAKKIEEINKKITDENSTKEDAWIIKHYNDTHIQIPIITIKKEDEETGEVEYELNEFGERKKELYYFKLYSLTPGEKNKISELVKLKENARHKINLYNARFQKYVTGLKENDKEVVISPDELNEVLTNIENIYALDKKIRFMEANRYLGINKKSYDNADEYWIGMGVRLARYKEELQIPLEIKNM